MSTKSLGSPVLKVKQARAETEVYEEVEKTNSGNIYQDAFAVLHNVKLLVSYWREALITAVNLSSLQLLEAAVFRQFYFSKVL